MQIKRCALFFLFAFSFAVMSLPVFAQKVIATVPVGSVPYAAAVNPVTNKTYIVNFISDNVTVIDGATFSTTNVTVGSHPVAVAVNSVTDKIYVANQCGNDPNCNSYSGTVTVIDGATNSTATVAVGSYPAAVAVNSATNKIYVANGCGDDPTCKSFSGTVTVIDGATLSTTSVTVGSFPVAVAVNLVTDKIYVVNEGSNNVTVIDGATNNTATVAVSYSPNAVAVNSVTNQIYVVNQCGNDPNCQSKADSVTVIDGATNNTTTVAVGSMPVAVAVNSVTNKIYVANECGSDPACKSFSGTVTVVDGVTLSTIFVSVGSKPSAVAADPVTNQIYAVNSCGADPSCLSQNGTVTAINGATNSTVTVSVGAFPIVEAMNLVTNRIYVANYSGDTVSVIAGANATALQFVAVTPCRVVDTRNAKGTFGGPPITGGTFRSFPLPHGGCNIPATAAAYSLNVTVVPPGPLGYLTIWPTGEDQPVVSTENSLDGRTKANAAIVPAGYSGAVSVFVSNTTDVVLDIDGYFAPVSGSTLAFYTLPPCRVADTRNSNGPLGGPYLSGGTPRDFPVLMSNCGIPNSAQAYSFNFTAVPRNGNPLGYLTVWPTGQNQPLVSTLNAPTGTTVANAALVPAGTGGEIDVFASNDSDLVIDINGYFAPVGSGGLSLYPVVPCRVLDTRQANGAFVGELTVDVVDSVCGPSNLAQAYVFNATVVPPAPLGYLTLWPDGGQQPLVSTLNALDGAITSNMAIVPTTNGSIDAFASNLTQLILDISGYFAP